MLWKAARDILFIHNIAMTQGFVNDRLDIYNVTVCHVSDSY